ncbi:MULTISPECIES: purine-cytosine permease family protein [Mycobacteriaceae]|uniref:Cytosine permease n=1 Tax=Mycolicibacterium parafortuitum TaxID=39692 RepID=A0ACC6MF39_MYCPF|nr:MULTISPECIES: cytosine permease [Mycobacteriaceae]MDZ5085591.1 cytosine permease [Mycolicibacterium parafortuitum]GFM19444.1 NCS1 family transporter [Mycobacterium sp. PO1]GFM25159.1 NCS1 family transporter [Mycobacterium sp. PO2]
MTTPRLPEGAGTDQVGHIETRGVGYIPEAERHSKPRELTAVFIGTQMCFGIIVLGYLPVSFGLGWWGSITSTLTGLLIGSALFAPLALLSTRTGTNSAVSSGAHFGVVGRMIGSLVGIFTAIGFYALTVWTGGQALIAGLHKLAGLPDTTAASAIAYAVIAALTLLVAIYGHANVVLANRILVPTMGILLLAGVFVLAPKFTAAAPSPELLLGSYPATWLLSATTAASLPISYSPYVGDYTRYISARTHRSVEVAAAAGVGMFVGCAVALCFAIYVAMTFPPDITDWVIGFVTVSPPAFVAAIVVIALLGSCAQAALCVYGTGLDTSSIFPSLKRVPATLLIGAAGTALVYIGAFVYNLVAAATAFLLILLVVTAPWLVINLLGYHFCRGRYYAQDLQVFNLQPRISGGAYWFTRGWNIAAMTAWLVATGVGMMFVHTTLYVGPWSNAAGGVDLSFLSAAAIGGILYAVLVRLVPDSVVIPTTVSEDNDTRRIEELRATAEAKQPEPSTPDRPVLR